jgi:hypothetical protein
VTDEIAKKDIGDVGVEFVHGYIDG